jgi:hypothetical protein
MSAYKPSIGARIALTEPELSSVLYRAHDLATYLRLTDTPQFEFARALQKAADLAAGLKEVLGKPYATGHTAILVRALDIALNRAQGIHADLKYGIDSAGVPDRALSVAADLSQAREFALTSASVPAKEERGAGRRVAPSAARLLAAATGLLAAADRARYSEEYRAELWEIAAAGGGRRQQLLYAIRQVRSAWRLRTALGMPRRGTAP